MQRFVLPFSLAAVTLLPALNRPLPAQAHPRTGAAARPEQQAIDTLPVTSVTLYKNGVGYFEHSGRITGNASVRINFTTAQLNDVLQSLTAIDLGGGRIAGANYNSTTPLEQQLKALPLDLSADPSDVDFYQAIRGARVAVTGPGLNLTGRLLSVDLRQPLAKPDGGDSAPDPTASRRFLTVVSDSGEVRTFELLATTQVRLLDPALKLDVDHYLELLATTRNAGLRHLDILDLAPARAPGRAPDRAPDGGTGTRSLRVSYLSEVPVWKSTYRLLVTDSSPGASGPAGASGGTATMQGYSVIDNTTGSDWTAVHLSLVAGAPQSFIQPLSTPYYTRRPEIPLPAEAQLTPQTHESGEMGGEQSAVGAGSGQGVAAVANESVEVNGAVLESKALMALPRKAPFVDGFSTATGSAPPPPAPYERLAEQSFQSQANAAAFDDFFQYTLAEPITIRKNESALVPILQVKVPVERVTLWSEITPTPLRALWLTNTSSLTLDRGSFTLVENGTFAGEGLFDPIHPAERRLLSFAADEAVRVTVSGQNFSSHVTQLKISRGVLTETSTEVQERTYNVRNAAPETRTVIVEHQVSPGYTLDSDPKPAEVVNTPSGDLDRFRVVTAPAETVHLHVGERRIGRQIIRLVDRTEDQLLLLLRNAHATPATFAALQPVFDAHAKVVALDEQIRARQSEINTITADQGRLRDDLKALPSSPEARTLATRYTGELNAQEDRLTALRREIADLQVQRNAADADFQARLEAVDLNETL